MSMRVEFIEPLQENIRQQRLVHWVLNLLAPVLLSVLLSCIEEPKVKKAQLGPEVSANQIYRALNDAMGNRNPTEIQVGDQTLYEINQRVETNAVIKLQDIRTEVRSRQEEKDMIIYLFDETIVDYQGNKPEMLRREVELRVTKPKLPEFSSAFIPPLTPLFLPFQGDLEQDIPVTYHNLQVANKMRAVPGAAARNLPDCEGQPTCHFNVSEVKFDVVRWPSSDDWKVTNHRYIYTSDTPYLAHLVLFCVKTLVDVGERDYFVSQCKVLRDFVAGLHTK